MNIHNEGHYLPKLLEVFAQCEDIDDRDALSHLYSIIKCLIMMNDMQLVEQMVSDQFFWGVVGALEYDPDLTPKKAEHRSFLKVRCPSSLSLCIAIPHCACALGGRTGPRICSCLAIGSQILFLPRYWEPDSEHARIDSPCSCCVPSDPGVRRVSV